MHPGHYIGDVSYIAKGGFHSKLFFIEGKGKPYATMSLDRQCQQYSRLGYYSKLKLKVRRVEVQPCPWIGNVSYITSGFATIRIY